MCIRDRVTGSSRSPCGHTDGNAASSTATSPTSISRLKSSRSGCSRRMPFHQVSKCREHPDLLDFSLEMLVGDVAVDEAAFPSVWPQGDLELPLTYQFEPGTEQDGVTVDIPLSVLARVRPEGFDRLVPGLAEDLVVALIRA